MKFSYKAALFSTILATFSMSASAETFAYRNEGPIDIASNGGPESYSLIVVYTNPIQANETVYSWRTHTTWSGTGSLGYNAEIVGETDDQGVLVLASNVANNSIYCGNFTNERFAVGSIYAPKSDPISFDIYRSMDFGPKNPNCDPDNVLN